MDFDSMDEIITMGSKEPHHSMMIMKGKRTKRPRQPSPASAVFTASSSSSGGDVMAGSGGKPPKIRSSESLCSSISTSTEEDEDMANCLILLAQSGVQNTMSTPIHVTSSIEKQEKYSSRKLKEMTITTSSTVIGKAGIYVYECKTCNRSFPSFQALGGHRTSHKKLKPTLEIEDKKQKLLPPLNDHHHQEMKQEEGKMKKFLKISPSSILELEISKKSYHGGIVINNNNKGKIHECSICGSEFSSGQALGGHMRRHRNPTNASTTTTATTAESSHDGDRPRNVLELDLNLPAPPEDDHHDSQFQFSLFSSPALVDCQ